MEVSGDRHCPESYHGSMFYAAENTNPQWVWERHFLLEFTLGCLTTMGELSPPRWGGTTQSLMGSLCPTASWTFTNTLYMKWNTYTENKEKVGFWSGISTSICSLLTVLSLLADINIMHSQVKFLKLLTALSPRPGGHILFPIGMITWMPYLFPPLA